MLTTQFLPNLMLSPSEDRKKFSPPAARSSSIFFSAAKGALSKDEWLKKTIGFSIFFSIWHFEAQISKQLAESAYFRTVSRIFRKLSELHENVRSEERR